MVGKRRFLDRLGWKVYGVPGLDRKILDMKKSFDQVNKLLKDYPDKRKR